MKRFKRITRLLGLVLLIILASAGGVPMPPPNKREDTMEIKVEVDDSDENKPELTQLEIKQ